MDSPTEFQFLLPPREKDPDRKMHEYLRREFLGIPQGKWAPADTAGSQERFPWSINNVGTMETGWPRGPPRFLLY